MYASYKLKPKSCSQIFRDQTLGMGDKARMIGENEGGV
jgi:hypothetical protein